MGFEPTVPLGTRLFESRTFDHSDISPCIYLHISPQKHLGKRRELMERTAHDPIPGAPCKPSKIKALRRFDSTFRIRFRVGLSWPPRTSSQAKDRKTLYHAKPGLASKKASLSSQIIPLSSQIIPLFACLCLLHHGIIDRRGKSIQAIRSARARSAILPH